MMKFRLLLTAACAAVLAAQAPLVTAASAQPSPKQVAPTEPPSQRETETPRSQAETVREPEGGQHVEWGYTGPSGPDHWSELSAANKLCAGGQQESPINLRGAVSARLGKLDVLWKPVPLRVANNGHTIQTNVPAGSTMRVGGQSYELLQFHAHHPSEHLLDGRRFPLELHFVHRAPDGTLGVLGVLVETGKPNATLKAFLDNMPAEAGSERAAEGRMLNPSGFLPRGRGYYRYEGSLTTPPCSETVDWVVLAKPIQASTAQINAFERVYPMNARPLQDLNRRFLLRSQ